MGPLLRSVKKLLGANNPNNAVKTNYVVSNPNGSIVERLEHMQEAISMSYDRNRSGVITIDWTDDDWKAAAAHEILNVTGVCRVRLAIEVVTNCSPAGATIKFGTPNVDLIAATTATGLDAGEFFTSSTLASNVKTLNWSSIYDVVTGEDIGFTVANTTMTSGSMDVYYAWEPLSSDGAVALASGGTFGS